jgi:hypothetical protein
MACGEALRRAVERLGRSQMGDESRERCDVSSSATSTSDVLPVPLKLPRFGGHLSMRKEVTMKPETKSKKTR